MSRLTDIVTAKLRGEIVLGRYPPGMRLTEAQLCREYGVSRVPVREALKSLETEGFIDYRPYAGVTVALMSSDDAADLFAVRRTIEMRTAGRCAERFALAGAGTEENTGLSGETGHFKEKLVSLVSDGLKAAHSKRTERLAQMNTDFHLSLAEFSGSASLRSLLHQVAAKIEWLYAMDVKVRAEHSWDEHQAISTAVLAGEVEAAKELIAQHVHNSHESYKSRRLAH